MLVGKINHLFFNLGGKPGERLHIDSGKYPRAVREAIYWESSEPRFSRTKFFLEENGLKNRSATESSSSMSDMFKAFLLVYPAKL